MLIIALVQLALLIVLLFALLFRERNDSRDVVSRLAEFRNVFERIEPSVREEMRVIRAELTEQSQQARKETGVDSRSLREELLNTFRMFGEQLSETAGESRKDQARTAGQLQESVQSTLVALGTDIREAGRHLSLDVQERLREVAAKITELTVSNEAKLEAIRQDVTNQLSELKTQHAESSEHLAESVQANFSRLSNDLRETSRQLNEAVHQRLEEVGGKVSQLSVANERSQESLRKAVEERMDKLNESNTQKLEEVRLTVDEKLHSTLEKRLTDSFGLVTEQLGSVQRGLGEMKDLATGVGDLKRVLTNIRSRGSYGEVQLEMLLDQILAPGQYIKNVNVRPDTQETVEFAIKFPGPASGESVLLPVDAKFPREAWEHLEDAHVRGDQEAVKRAGERLEAVIRTAARDISAKYIEPPLTLDFAIMFLPTEGLFAEVVRRPGLIDELRTKCHVTVAGPTTFAALLTSFQMGFRTLAIQKKGSEVWKVLGAAKSEFGKFGVLMDRVEKNIGTVQHTLHDVSKRTRVITRTLSDVETADVPAIVAAGVLELNESSEGGPDKQEPEGNEISDFDF